MIKLLNSLLIFFGYKIIRVIPKPSNNDRVSKAEVSRRYKINYNTVGWLHVQFVKENPAITRSELIEKVKQYHQNSRQLFKKNSVSAQ